MRSSAKHLYLHSSEDILQEYGCTLYCKNPDTNTSATIVPYTLVKIPDMYIYFNTLTCTPAHISCLQSSAHILPAIQCKYSGPHTILKNSDLHTLVQISCLVY
jgi:uroporphyrinogen-III decarboxylase